MIDSLPTNDTTLSSQAQVSSDPGRGPYDDITHLATITCDTPIAAIGLGNDANQWIKSSIGLSLNTFPRRDSLYTYALTTPEKLLIVPNLQTDKRFTKSVFANGQLNIRFFAGVPLHSDDGMVLGMLFVMDSRTRSLSKRQIESLHRLANQAIRLYESETAEAVYTKRSAELQIITRVSALVSSETETASLLQDILNSTKDDFTLYHAQIYELNEQQDTLLLTVGAGEIGRRLRELGHRIPLKDQQSLVARSARTRAAIIENDLRQAPNFLPNPLLPHSQASLALPMIVGNRVMGVLNVQADRPGHFTDEDIRIHTALATQIAAALQTSRSIEASEEALQELNALTRRLTHEGWSEYLNQSETDLQLAYDAQQLTTLTTPPESPSSLSTDLTIQGTSIGQLALSTPQLLEDEAAEIMAAVAEHLSTHLENLRLSEQTEQVLLDLEQYSQRLTQLNEMASQLSNAESLQSVYQIAAKYANLIFQSKRSSISTYQPMSDDIAVTAIDGITGVLQTSTVIPLDGTAIGQVIKSGELLIVNLASSTTLEAPFLLKQGLQSMMLAPLIVRERPIGTFNVGSTLPNGFSSTDESLMLQMASLLANTIDNQALTGQIQRRLADMTAIQTTTAELSTSVDLNSAVRSLMPLVSDALGADSVALMAIEGNHITNLGLYPPLPADVNVPKTQADNPIIAAVVGSKTAKVVNINDPALNETSVERFKQFNIYSTIVTPILRQNDVWGIMVLTRQEPGRGFDETDLALAQTIADQASIAFERATLFEQTQLSLAETAEQARRLALLNELADELNRAEDFDRVVNVSVYKAQQMFSTSRASLSRIEPDREHYRLLLVGGNEGNITAGKLMSLETSAIGTAMNERKIVIVNQSKDGNLPGINSFMVVPLIVNDVVIGSLNLGSEKLNYFTGTDENLGLQVTSLIAATLENRRLLEETQRLFAREQGRARREQLLREITAKVRSSTDPDVIMRTAVRELSHALGRESFVYLGESEDLPGREQENNHE